MRLVTVASRQEMTKHHKKLESEKMTDDPTVDPEAPHLGRRWGPALQPELQPVPEIATLTDLAQPHKRRPRAKEGEGPRPG